MDTAVNCVLVQTSSTPDNLISVPVYTTLSSVSVVSKAFTGLKYPISADCIQFVYLSGRIYDNDFIRGQNSNLKNMASFGLSSRKSVHKY
jgi:hypothetical protein